MTVPNERLNSLRNTKEFLRNLLDPKKTPRVPKKVRREAYYCLKHFPESPYLESFEGLEMMVKEGKKNHGF